MNNENVERVIELYRRAWRVCAAILRTERQYQSFTRFSVTMSTFEVMVNTPVKIAGINPLQELADGSGFELFALPLAVRPNVPGDAVGSWGIRLEIET